MPLPDVHPTRPGVVAPVRTDRTGRTGPTRDQARGPHWRRSSRGLYVPSLVPRTTDQRIVEAAAVLPPYGAVTGWAALHWIGGRWFESADREVTLATAGRTVRRQPGIAICEEKLAPADLEEVDGVRVTTAVRSVCFEMRYARSLRDAIAVLDMAAYSDLVSIAELAAYAVDHPAWTGIPQCRDAIPYADENVWSPTESAMRWTWSVEAGFRQPLCNRPVFDRSGNHLGTPDLIDPIAGVVGEYDGSLHLLGHQRAKDLDREARFRSVGLEVVTMVAADRVDPTRFVERLRTAYARALCQPNGPRAWSVDPPSWWTSTTTVAARRRLDRIQQARLLRYRHA